MASIAKTSGESQENFDIAVASFLFQATIRVFRRKFFVECGFQLQKVFRRERAIVLTLLNAVSLVSAVRTLPGY